MYDHAKKAGNRGDVWKHFILLETVQALCTIAPRDSVFRYFETHAGGGTYPLQNHGEWRNGIGRDAVDRYHGQHPYFRILPADVAPGSVYHGSWKLVAAYLRHRMRPFHFILCDIVPAIADEIALYHLHAGETLEPRCVDGFAEIRMSDGIFDLVLLDPPYYPFDTTADWAACIETVASLRERNLPYLAWYPLIDSDAPRALRDTAMSTAFEIRWQRAPLPGSRTMNGAGMLASHAVARILTQKAPDLEMLAQSLGGVFAPRTVPD